MTLKLATEGYRLVGIGATKGGTYIGVREYDNWPDFITSSDYGINFSHQPWEKCHAELTGGYVAEHMCIVDSEEGSGWNVRMRLYLVNPKTLPQMITDPHNWHRRH